MRTWRMIGLSAALAASPVLAAAPGGAGSAGGGAPMTSITLSQALDLVRESGAVVTEQGSSAEGFSINIQYANGLYGFVDGRECVGEGAETACAEIETGGVFILDTAEEALRYERELSYIWVADHAEGADLTVWRRDCLHGGVTRAQVLHWIVTMESQLAEVSMTIWPEDGVVARPSHGSVET